jgi:ABC-type lipoprotein release transport system permease subunit
MKLLIMAWRNLLRSKRRTAITACSVAFGVLLAVTFTGSGDYSYTKMINTSSAMGLGHLTIEPPGYNDAPSLGRTLNHSEAIRDKVMQHPEIDDALPRIMGQAMFASGANSAGGMFLAIDPSLESSAYNIFLQSLVQGTVFSEKNSRGVVIGVKMAEKLKLKTGRKLVITTTDKNGEIVATVGRVSGIFKTGDDSADGSIALLSIDHLRTTLNYTVGEVSLISVFIKDQRRAWEVQKKLLATNWQQELDILTWETTQVELAGLIAIDRASNYLLQFLVGLIIAAGITNTLLISVLERTREFGIMMAIGMRPGQIVAMILIESLWIGLLGLALGVLVTTPWYLYMHYIGLNLSSLIGEDYSAAGVIIDPVLKIRLFRESVVAILAGIFFLTITAGIYPAFKASLAPPVESLKRI